MAIKKTFTLHNRDCCVDGFSCWKSLSMAHHLILSTRHWHR